MNNSLANVEIGDRLPLENNDYSLNMRVFTTAGFAIQGEITLKTAKLLAHELWLAFNEISLRDRQTEEAVYTEVRRRALLRNDHHVRSDRVLCAHDHCNELLSTKGRPIYAWDQALAEGWDLLWKVPMVTEDQVIHYTDLVCPDCHTIKEFCSVPRRTS